MLAIYWAVRPAFSTRVRLHLFKWDYWKDIILRKTSLIVRVKGDICFKKITKLRIDKLKSGNKIDRLNKSMMSVYAIRKDEATMYDDYKMGKSTGWKGL